MKKNFKVLFITVIILISVLFVLHFISLDNNAINGIPILGFQGGTLQSNGLCLGDSTNC